MPSARRRLVSPTRQRHYVLDDRRHDDRSRGASETSPRVSSFCVRLACGSNVEFAQTTSRNKKVKCTPGHSVLVPQAFDMLLQDYLVERSSPAIAPPSAAWRGYCM